MVLPVALAACVCCWFDFNYDDRKNSCPPNRGDSNNSPTQTMNAPFPGQRVDPQQVHRRAFRNLRIFGPPRALADMEQMANRISQLPDIAAVRGITRPNGEMLYRGAAPPIRPARWATSWTKGPSLITGHSR